MTLKGKKILGLNVTINNQGEVLEEIRKYLVKTQIPNPKSPKKVIKPLVIFTPNPEIVSFAQKDEQFKQVVNTAQINLPDGGGIVWAMEKLHKIKIGKITGTDFMLKMIFLAQKESVRIGLIGGKPGVAVATSECLRRSHPNLKIEVFDTPEVKITNYKLQITNKFKIQNSKTESDKDTSGVTEWAPPMVEELENKYFNSLAKEVSDKHIDILFVALGFPKQEYFIHELVNSLLLVHSERTNELTMNPLVIMAVGGAFDYISGRVPRAPKLFRNLGLEWLFRLLRQPWRLPRQIRGASFFWRVSNS